PPNRLLPSIRCDSRNWRWISLAVPILATSAPHVVALPPVAAVLPSTVLASPALFNAGTPFGLVQAGLLTGPLNCHLFPVARRVAILDLGHDGAPLIGKSPKHLGPR